MKQVSVLLDKDYTILALRLQLLEQQHTWIREQRDALVVTMRKKVGADLKATYDPRTRTFVPPAGPASLKAPTKREWKRAQSRPAPKKETAP